MSEVIVVELNSVSHEHARVNCGYVRLLLNNFSKVTLFCSTDHYISIKSIDASLRFNHVAIDDESSSYLSHSRQLKKPQQENTREQRKEQQEAK